MNTVEADIRAALVTRLQNMPNLPDVAWENRPYAPTGAPFLEPHLLWAEGQQAEVGDNGRNWERGVLQIDCNYPLGDGVGNLYGMVGNIKDWFKRGTDMTYNGLRVRVRKVSLSPLRYSDTFVTISVSVSFLSQTPN